MNQSYNQLFDEKDLLEENKFQTIYKGCYKDQPQHRVIIQKFKMNDTFDAAFKDFLDNTLQNKLHIEILQDEIILVSKYIEGDNISLHLNFASVTETERMDYLYDYLHQATAYIGFEYYLLNILIGSNQIVFKEHKLYLKEQINLDRKLNENIPFTLVAKNIGQVMQRILITNYNELATTTTYDNLHHFTESLIRREKDYVCFDDLFNDFKAIYFKKQGSKNQTLMGNAHPNNIFMEFVEIKEYDDQTTKEIPEPLETNQQVTEEERAFLTGNILSSSNFKPAHDVPESVKNVDETPEDDYEDIYQPHPAIDWSNGPIEENIDLSKLMAGVTSFEEVLVREEPIRRKKKKTITKVNSVKEETIEAEIIMPSEVEEPKDKAEFMNTITNDLDDTEYDAPVYGLPNHFKDSSFKTIQVEEDNHDEKKKPFKVFVPLAIFAALLLVIFAAFAMLKLVDKEPIIGLPPVAEFVAELKGNTLHCTNLSTASEGLNIKESFWELTKNNEIIASTPGKNNADYEVKGLTAGTYTIKLTVTDSNHINSDPYSQNVEYLSDESKALENQIQTQNELTTDQAFKAVDSSNEYDEIMDQYTISTTVNVVEDTYTLNKGTKSYRINLNKNDGSASLYFDPLNIEQGATVSFMIMTNEAKPITIQLIGYYEGNNIFTKEVISNKGTVLDWTTLSIQMSTTSPTDKLVIKLDADNTIVWFDELSIRTFK